MSDKMKAMVDRFLQWPLPESVCADLCATKQGPGRIGTNLLTATEAQQMLEYVLSAAPQSSDGWIPVGERLPEQGISVLVTDGGDVFTGGYGTHFSTSKHEHIVGWYGHNFGYDGDSDSVDATHWMPLPSQPEKDK